MGATPDTIVLIHGLWMTPRSWEHWIERFTGKGFTVIAPSWPGMEAENEDLREDPSPIARVSAPEIIDHYERIIDKLERPPIIMGHSFCGGFVQALLDRGVGAAGVAIDPAPPKGVLKLPFSTIRSGWSILRNPANKHKAVPFSAKQFRYAFGNTLTEEASQVEYERYAVPGADADSSVAARIMSSLLVSAARSSSTTGGRPRSSTRSSPVARTTRADRTGGKRSLTTR